MPGLFGSLRPSEPSKADGAVSPATAKAVSAFSPPLDDRATPMGSSSSSPDNGDRFSDQPVDAGSGSVEVSKLQQDIERMHKERFSIFGILRHYFSIISKNGYVRAGIFWGLWMITGTIFYAIRNELGWPLGFYMMVNVGYSVGWGYPVELDNHCRWFSTINVFVGAVALSYALNVFAQGVVKQSKNWYSLAIYEIDMNSNKTKWIDKQINWCLHHSKQLLTILVALVWIMAMTSWAVFSFADWTFINGFYFSVGSLSTGGMHPIPRESTSTQFIIAGIFTAIGTPLMGLMVMNATTLALTIGDPEKAKKMIRSKVTLDELKMMSRFGFEDGDGVIDRSEFVLLCCVRLGALNHALIEEINRRFDKLDLSKKGYLTRDEILQDFRRGNLYSRWTRSDAPRQSEAAFDASS